MEKKPLPKRHDLEALKPPLRISYRYFEPSAADAFDFQATEFKLGNAWWLADASLLAYVDSADDVREQLPPSLRSQLVTFSHQGTQCYVTHGDQYALIVFRGTEIRGYEFLLDVITDAQAFPVDAGTGGAAHKGFQSALDHVWNDAGLGAHLRTLQQERPETRFWLAGHSLGGALAMLAAARLESLGTVGGVYTYGCPRVGDEFFARSYRPRSFRVVHGQDPVPLLPPRPPLHLGLLSSLPFLRPYTHVGYRIHVSAGDSHQVSPDLDRTIETQATKHLERRGFGSTPSLLQRLGLRGRGLPQSPPDQLKDHAPIYYAIKLWNAYCEMA